MRAALSHATSISHTHHTIRGPSFKTGSLLDRSAAKTLARFGAVCAPVQGALDVCAPVQQGALDVLHVLGLCAHEGLHVHLRDHY